MATSGSIETQVKDGTDILGTKGWGKFDWVRSSYSFKDNTSTISWTISLKLQWGIYPAGGGGRQSFSKVRVVIDGKSVEYIAAYTGAGAGKYTQLLTGTTTIQHNINGDKTASIAVYISQYSYANEAGAEKDDMSYCYDRPVSGSATLDNIPRPAEVTGGTDFNDETSPGVFYKCNTPDLVDKVEACISFTGATDDVPYREIRKDLRSYYFVLTDEEKATLRRGITSGNSRTVRFYVRTTAGDQVAWNYVTKTLTLINYEPILSPTVTDTNPDTAILTGDINKLVRYYSRAYVVFGAEARKEATITRKTVTNGSQTFNIEDANQDSITINDIEDNVFTLSMTDSRGHVASEQVHFKGDNFIPYFKVTCNQTISLTLDKTIEMTVKGNYYNGSFGATDNELTIQTRHREVGEEWGEWENISVLTEDISNGTYTLNTTLTDYDPSGTYEFQSRVLDKLTVAESAVETITLQPIFDWGKNDFNFNVPLTIEGYPLADYVIEEDTKEMGSNGTWYWRKWKSGRAECCGCRNFGAMSVTIAWGGLYRSSTFTQSFPSGLFVATPEVIDISFRGGSNYGGWIVNHEYSAPTASATGSFIMVRPASTTLENSYISFNVIGRWK